MEEAEAVAKIVAGGIVNVQASALRTTKISNRMKVVVTCNMFGTRLAEDL